MDVDEGRKEVVVVKGERRRPVLPARTDLGDAIAIDHHGAGRQDAIRQDDLRAGQHDHRRRMAWWRGRSGVR